MVIVEVGEGFTETKLYCYSVDGTLLCEQHLDTEEIKWYYNGHYNLKIPNTEATGFYPE